MLRGVTMLLMGGLLAAPAAAQEPAPAEEQPLHLVTDYAGVVPGAPARPKKRPAKPTLTWIGFQAEGGAPRVFVQASHPITAEQRLAGDELVISLGELAIGERNNTRPLDCRFFGTDVARVWATRARKGQVELHVRFKDKGAARQAAAKTSEEGGFTLLLLDLGAASPRE
jgi:hypothetical protein